MAAQDKDYALVVGINDYPNFQNLNGAVLNAQKFHQWLIDPQGGGLPSRNASLVLSTLNPLHPVYDDIEDALIQIKERVRNEPNRRFYFYFSGHGMGVSHDSAALCLAKWSKYNYRNYALRSREYLELLVKWGFFSEVIFFLDCCRIRLVEAHGIGPSINGVNVSDDPAGTRTYIAYATEYLNSAYESSVAEDRPLDEDTLSSQGFFTRALLDGLRGGAASEEGPITAASLKTYLELNTIRLAQQEGRHQNAQIINGLLSNPEPFFGSKTISITDEQAEESERKCKFFIVFVHSRNTGRIAGQ